VPAPDFTDKYNTKLSADDEKKFGKWLQDAGKEGDLKDYDLRGWWKENGQQDDRGHMTDEFKKPNHPTFSDESKYDGVDGNEGGHWGGTDEKPTFTPSDANLKNLTADELKSYFARVEPDAELKLPEKASAGGRAATLYTNPGLSVQTEAVP
jgi:hypothetical protein